MKYSVQIERSIGAFTDCLQRVNNNIDTWDWNIYINAGGIDYGVYFNFDIERKELEICNQARYSESLYLDDIIEEINEFYNEDDENDYDDED